MTTTTFITFTLYNNSNRSYITVSGSLYTFGPHRACLVAQHISVLQTLHLIQSQPSFFCTTILHDGQCIALPSFNIFYTHTERERERVRNDSGDMVWYGELTSSIS